MQLGEKKQVLAKNFLFRQLKAKDLERVAKLALEHHYDHGQIIFQKGQPEREKDIGMMAVIAGRVKISTCSPDDKEIILNRIEPGGFFSEIALIDGKGHSADAPRPLVNAGCSLSLAVISFPCSDEILSLRCNC
jgi:CRP/FNR family cyclic AMP-dependent transcriptional regulator